MNSDWFVVFANFHNVSTPAVASVELPTVPGLQNAWVLTSEIWGAAELPQVQLMSVSPPLSCLWGFIPALTSAWNVPETFLLTLQTGSSASIIGILWWIKQWYKSLGRVSSIQWMLFRGCLWIFFSFTDHQDWIRSSSCVCPACCASPRMVAPSPLHCTGFLSGPCWLRRHNVDCRIPG